MSSSAGLLIEPLVGLEHAERVGPTLDLPDMPAHLPSFLESPLAWSGDQFFDASDFVLVLNEDDRVEIETALADFKGLGLDGDLVSCQNFKLPKLAKRLLRLQHDIYHGRGFGMIRGLDPKRYTVEDLTAMYLGLQVYIGSQFGRQDEKGNMIVHVVADSSTKMKSDHHRHSTAHITFHNEEAGDVVSWLTRTTAENGGNCVLSSAYTIYNVLAASRPDLLRVLARADWPFALPVFQCRPVLFWLENRLIMNFGRTPLLGSAAYPRPTGLPSLAARQVEALDAVEKIARAIEISIKTEPGDIHFINNLAILHRRDEFANGQSACEKRHLVRMRLRNHELGWAIPAELQAEWEKAFAQEGAKTWHLEPMPDGFFPLRSHAN